MENTSDSSVTQSSKPNIIRRLYDWVLSWADSRYGVTALFILFSSSIEDIRNITSRSDVDFSFSFTTDPNIMKVNELPSIFFSMSSVIILFLKALPFYQINCSDRINNLLCLIALYPFNKLLHISIASRTGISNQIEGAIEWIGTGGDILL